MSRLENIEEKLEKIEQAMDSKTRKKQLGFMKKLERLGKKTDRMPNTVLVQYLSQKYQIEFLVCKVVSGNLVVIRNKAYELNPKSVWRFKKQLWYIIREIDRKPVSNLDWNKVKARRDDTEADVPLIKAVLGAVQKKSGTKLEGKSLWILVIIGIVAAVILFMFLR